MYHSGSNPAVINVPTVPRRRQATTSDVVRANLRVCPNVGAALAAAQASEQRFLTTPATTTMAGSFKPLKHKGGYIIKKLLIAATVAVLMAFNFAANAQQPVAVDDINIGDYIDGFGNLKWRVIGKDENGLLVRTDRAVGVARNFSSARASGYTNPTLSTATNQRPTHGTNRWHETEMRAWLNGIQWIDGNIPANPFTSRFSARELSAVATVEQIQHLWNGDVTRNSVSGAAFNMPPTSGSANLSYTSGQMISIPYGYNTAYRTTISDRIFLLDVQQAYNISMAGGSALRNVSTITTDQEGRDSYHIVVDAAGTRQQSWLRTPHADSQLSGHTNLRSVLNTGNVTFSGANSTTLYVAPALYISPTAFFTRVRASDATLALNAGREQEGYQVYSFLTTQDILDVDEAKDGITWDEIKGANAAQDNVTANLATLPTSHANGATISWSSNNTAVIANNGSVTRPTGNNATVTLTATITKGAASDQVVFTLTVIALKEVTAAEIGFTIPTGRVYNGLAQGLQISPPQGMGAITVFYNGSATAPVNAGTYDITVNVAAGVDYVSATGVSLGNYTIDKLQLAWDAYGTAHSKTYDGTTDATIDVLPTLLGVIAGDEVTVTPGTVKFGIKDYLEDGIDMITENFGIGGADAGNYEVSDDPPFESGIIHRVQLTWDAANPGTVGTLTYNGTTVVDPLDLPALSGVIDGEVLTVVEGTVNFADPNVGAGKAIIVSNDWGIDETDPVANNYIAPVGAPPFLPGDIIVRPVTIGGVTAAHKVYDGSTVATVSGTHTPSHNFDGANLTVVSGAGAFADANAADGITVTFSGFTLGGSASGNYTLAAQPAPVTANITRALLTLTADDKVINTGDAEPEYTYHLDGLVADETEAVITTQPAFTLDPPTFDSSVEAEFAIIPNNAAAANYEITHVAGKLTVVDCAHDWSVLITIISPTCTEAGEGHYQCSLCGMVDLDAVEIAALGHDWGIGWITITQPTPTTDGKETRTCSLCGEEEENVLPATGSVTNVPELLSANPLKAWMRGGLLHIEGITVGETLSIYSVSGALVHQSKPQSEEVDVDLKIQGVYIVRSGGNVVRVVVR